MLWLGTPVWPNIQPCRLSQRTLLLLGMHALQFAEGTPLLHEKGFQCSVVLDVVPRQKRLKAPVQHCKDWVGAAPATAPTTAYYSFTHRAHEVPSMGDHVYNPEADQ